MSIRILSLSALMLTVAVSTASAAHQRIQPELRGVLTPQRPKAVEGIQSACDIYGDHLFRTVSVFLKNPNSPAVQRLIYIPSPGTSLCGDVLSVFSNNGQDATLNSAGSFEFTPFGPKDHSFDQVNAYFTANQELNTFFLPYGWDPLAHPVSIYVDANQGGPITYSSSVTLPAFNGRSSAKDADVVAHETAHAVYNPLVFAAPTEYAIAATHGSNEVEAFGEGLADYYAWRKNGDTQLFEWLFAPTNGYRELNTNPSQYNYNNSSLCQGLCAPIWSADPHIFGLVFVGALMSLEQSVGPLADELIFTASQLGASASFRNYYDVIRWADLEIYGDNPSTNHQAAITAAFASRGISAGPLTDVAVTGPSTLDQLEPAQFVVKHVSGFGPFTYKWFELTGGSWQQLSETSPVLSMPGRYADYTLRAEVTNHSGVTASSPARTITVAPMELPATAISIDGEGTIPFMQSRTFTAKPNGFVNVDPAPTWTANGVPIGQGWSIDLANDPQPGPGAPALPQQVTLVVTLGTFTSSRVIATPSMFVSISGPASLASGATSPYSAVIVGGTGPFSFNWNQNSPAGCDGSGDHCNDGGSNPLGDTQTVQSQSSFVGPIELSCSVQDSRGGFASASLSVFIGGSSPAAIVSQDDSPRIAAVRWREGVAQVSLGTTVREGAEWTATVMDVQGRSVGAPMSGKVSGDRAVVLAGWSGRARGIYFVRITVGGRSCSTRVAYLGNQ